ncbi:trypanothione synthetase/amidase [Strigomonas culicis]|nr:trypanothione synthetase/amidase [Strigomonas culicis]|eukprot:EPY29618.1 trypanothione synthetase/amidase [Strigomonas culicis]
MAADKPTYTLDREGYLPFGEVQGYAPGGIPAYSNKHDHFFSGERSLDGDVFCGFKYQCVEFARRWLLERKGLVLPEVNWACHIFQLSEVFAAASGEPVAVLPIRNGTTAKPVADSLIIYPSSDANIVGHVGVITAVGDDYVCVADQNYRFHKWEGDYNFKLKLDSSKRGEDGATLYTIIDDIDPADVEIPLGWVTFPDVPNRDPATATALTVHPSLLFRPPADPYLYRRTFQPTVVKPNWLDLSNPAEKLFVEEFGMDVSRSRLEENEATYYEANQELWLRCVAYGTQLHGIFMEATEKVIADDALLRVFQIPEEFWPRLRHSWNYQRTYISGRFDFVFNNETKSFKCFEYNADSASTLLECGRIQEKWAASIGLDQTSTRSSGFLMMRNLTMAWRQSGATGRVHFLVDDDREEQYTALYCMEGAAAAGLDTKLCVMFDEFHFNADGVVVDSDDVPVRAVWKTWMWETAISDYYKAKEERGAGWKPSPQDKVRLCDVLLPEDPAHWDILYFEPMWKLIPSNKAILPLIYHSHPNHPAILKAEYELTPELQQQGYAQKPIVGRVGRNVTITSGDGEVRAASQGNYGERDMIYQELFNIVPQDGYYAIMGGWMLGDAYSGTGIREDRTIITGLESPFSAIRIKLDTIPKPVTHDDVDKTVCDE